MSSALRKLHKSVSVLQYLLKLSALIQIPRGRESVVRYIPVKKYDSSPPLWPTLPPRVMISTNLNLLYHRKDASTLICFSFSGRSVFKKTILKDFSLTIYSYVKNSTPTVAYPIPGDHDLNSQPSDFWEEDLWRFSIYPEVKI